MPDFNILLKISILFFFMLISITSKSQESEVIVCYEIEDLFSLSEEIINKQLLSVEPEIIEVKAIQCHGKTDTIALYLVEVMHKENKGTVFKNYLRISRTSDLTEFLEIKYNDTCSKKSSSETNLKIGAINISSDEYEILYGDELFCVLKTK
ncbi:hypothetical protein [Owenweeksia hongkongensis]|uniref:hypothetical protein n=1 Tax=Owenweeksia hongkongensis TaxID=253245 RepID=UPI003A92BA05